MGWIHWVSKRDRIDERYRYEYPYFTLYISVSMDELESRRTMETAAKLLGLTIYEEKRPPKPTVLHLATMGGPAREIISQLLPYLDKWECMATFLLTVFRFRLYHREADFRDFIIKLFGKYYTPEELNPVLLKITPEEYANLIKRTHELIKLRGKSGSLYIFSS